jgi:hypothetical protein
MGYSAGNLELSILGFSEKAVASIDVTAKALRRLASAVDKINNTQFVFAGQKLEVLFTKIAKATNSINTTNITNLASAAKSLSSISRLSNLEKMDFEKVGKGFNTLAVAIQPFLDRVKEAEASLTALDGVLRRSSGKKIQGLLGGGATDNKKGGFLGFAKLGVNLYMMRRLGRFMGDLVQAGSDYNETLNLWQVAMRNNLDVAEQFVNKMQKAYGISTKTLMNAQAIFKNMIGSLGQISDQTAYALSEALVQMSADFASLYNVSIESAFEKMKSMLAGQVRPIRFAGLDITETTLFQFYQQLGGTKTMRQLNRTEKQLLSILAVYQQMGSAGALGDMSKTLNLFANQSRMMTEYWTDLKTWSGLLLKDLIDGWGILVKINALLITVTDVVKAIAKSRGLGDENFIDEIFEVTKVTNDEIDELQGKLLDFDKFRSLEGASASPLAIDEKLLEAIAGYSSKIDQAENAAQKLAETWLEVLGFTKDANGEFTIAEVKLDTISNTFEAIGITVGIIVGYRLFPWLLKVATGATGAAAAMTLLNYAIIGGVVFAVIQAIDAFERGDYWAGIFATTIGVVLVGSFVLLHKKAIVSALLAIGKFLSTIIITNVVARGFALGITGLSLAFVSLSAAAIGVVLLLANWSDMNTAQRIAAVCGIIATAVLGVAMAMGAFHSAWSLGLAAAGIAAGIAAIATSFATIKKDAQTPIQFAAVGASNLDGGTLFVAGEMGKTEAVFTGSNGKTNVANIQQMKAAELQALKEWWATAKNDIPVFTGISDSGIYTMVEGEARRRGKQFSKVR